MGAVFLYVRVTVGAHVCVQLTAVADQSRIQWVRPVRESHGASADLSGPLGTQDKTKKDTLQIRPTTSYNNSGHIRINYHYSNRC